MFIVAFDAGLDIFNHLVSCSFIRAEPLCPCLGLALAKDQIVFLLQFLADVDIPLQPVAVGNAFAIVVHAVEDEVTVGIGSIVVAANDILSVIDSHLFHILLCHLHHKLVGQAWLVLQLKTDGYVANGFADSWIQLGLDLETFGGDLRIVGNEDREVRYDFASCLDSISRYSSTVICTVTIALLPHSCLLIITDFNKFYTKKAMSSEN